MAKVDFWGLTRPVQEGFVATTAGFVVLGTFTGVSPAALSQVMDVHNLFVIGLVVFAVFAASTAGQLGSSRFHARTALPLGAALPACLS